MTEFITLILIPSVTALLVAIVTWTHVQQHKLARDKFKLDMFEKRFAVYKGVQEFLTIILDQPSKFGVHQVHEFRRKTQDSTFLFGEDISSYIAEIDEKALDMGSAVEEYKDLPAGQQQSAVGKKRMRLEKELTEQLPRLKEVFAPYLRFDKWK